MSLNSDQHQEISETRAKAGRRGTHTFWILVISFTLAAVAMFFAWTMIRPERADTPQERAAAPAEATRFNAPETPPPTQLPTSPPTAN